MKGKTKCAIGVVAASSTLLWHGCAGPDTAGIVGAGVPIPLPGTYKFRIDSEPPGAEIFFNGQYKGTAPLAWERTLLFQTIQTITIEGFYPASLSVGKASGNNYGQKPKVEGNAQTRQWGTPARSLIMTLCHPP